MKAAVSIPDPIFEEADQLAHKLGISRSALYASAVQAYVKARRTEDITAALDRIYSVEDSSLDPVMVALQAMALPKDEW